MSKKLTTSEIERRNVLNNPYALEEVQNAVDLQGLVFEEKLVFTKEQVASFFEVSVRTIENYLAQFEEELAENGYEVIRGKRLKALKLSVEESDHPETDFGIINWQYVPTFKEPDRPPAEGSGGGKRIYEQTTSVTMKNETKHPLAPPSEGGKSSPFQGG